MTKLFTYAFLIQSLSMNFLFAWNGNAQIKSIEDVMVQIPLHEESIENVFSKIEKASAFSFVYTNRDIRSLPKISMENKSQSLYEVLKEIAVQAGLEFKQVNNSILVQRSSNQASAKAVTIADDIVITGTVTDTNGEPIPGVTISLPGTTVGTATDLDGKYSLTVPEGSTLVFSFIGFETQSIAVGDQSLIDVILSEDMASLDEVVVIGYGTMKKGDLTGSVASIDTEDINSPVTSVDQALVGLAPGVNVVQTSGKPGAGTTIRIRGGNSISANNEPLYVVDGFVGVDGLNTINPQDIESIEVLKDAASLAIYGTRGANGVVLITTKKGTKGDLRIDYHGYGGIQNVFKKIDLMNAQQFAELRNEVDVQQGLTPFFPNPNSLGQGTDWQDQIFRSAPIQDHQLSFSGGSDATQYFVSTNYFNQEGIIIKSGFERYSLRFNLNSKVNERVSFGSSIALSRGETNNNTTEPPLDFPPTLAPFDAQGNPSILLFDGRRLDNPLTLATVPISESNENKVLANLFGELTLLEGLKFKASFGVQGTFGKSNRYDPQTLESQATNNGTASVSSFQKLDLLNEYTLNYKKTFSDRHYFDVLAGFTLQDIKTEGLSASSSGFVNDALTFYSLGSGENLGAPESNLNEASFISYLNRINYIFDDKYLFTFAARVDGSSKFGQANKYAFFPSAAVAWRLSEEEFLQNSDFFDDLKLRVSYGIIGNTPDQSYISIPTLSKSTYNFGGALVNGFQATRLANENLKWERTSSFDIGLDASILNNRVQLTFDYYHKKTTDLLLDVQIPSETGFSSSFQNVGSLKNNGIDISITTININKGNFSWQTTLNLSGNRNEILELSGEDEIFVAISTGGLGQQPAGILRVGEAVGSFYGLVSDGIWNSQQEIDEAGITSTIRVEPGAERYKDINGDKIIDGNDRTILGNDTPDLFGGIINRLSYKNWELNIFFDGTFGNETFNFNDAFQAAPTGGTNQYAEIANRWSETNPGSNILGASISAGSLEPRSRWIKDASYLRLRDFTLAYNIPSEIISWLNSSQVYVSGTNLFRIDNYNGYDPHISGYGQNNLRRATDLGGYPSSKVYRIGVKLGF